MKPGPSLVTNLDTQTLMQILEDRLASYDAEQSVRLEALSVALQHPAVAADQHHVCRLQLVCKAWRGVVQQSSACMTDVKVRVIAVEDHKSDASSDEAAGFHNWLAANAGMVRSINIQHVSPSAACGKEITMQQLVRALQTAAARATYQSATSAAGTAAAYAIDGAVVLPALQLQSFSSKFFEATSDILSVLPAATLTLLEIKAPSLPDVSMQHAVQQLTNLRSLRLEISRCEESSSDYVGSINRLTRLTSLHLHSLCDDRALESLPKQLCELDVSLFRLHKQPAQIQLSHMTKLQQLSLHVMGGIAPGSALPQQLQQLELSSNWSPSLLSCLSAASLAHLQRIKVRSDLSAADLLLLKSLPCLQEVSLEYHSPEDALRAAPMWPQLPILDLSLNVSCCVTEGVALFQSLSALGQLTSLGLELFIDVVDEAVDHHVPLQLFAPLKQLTRLRRLFCMVALPSVLEGADPDTLVTVEQHDLLHLSCLTQLTKLELHCDWFVHSAVPVALLMQMTNLQSLFFDYIDCNGLEHALPLIGKLTNLTSLTLSGLPNPQPEGYLQYLTQLRNLKVLSGCSSDIMEQFWSIVRA